MNDMPVYLIFGTRRRDRVFPEGTSEAEAVRITLNRQTEADYEMLKGYSGGKAISTYALYLQRVEEHARRDWGADQNPELLEVFKVAVERSKEVETRAEYENTPTFVKWLS